MTSTTRKQGFLITTDKLRFQPLHNHFRRSLRTDAQWVTTHELHHQGEKLENYVTVSKKRIK